MVTTIPAAVSASKAAKGLATLAMLKVNFDRGHDHIEMFMPFVVDCAASIPAEEFGSEEVRALVLERYELNMPESVLATLLARIVRRGHLMRTAGRYKRTGPPITRTTINEESVRIAREHGNVAAALRAFALQRGIEILSDEEALALILKFFEQFHVALLVDADPGPLLRLNEVASRREIALVARFLEETFSREPARAEYLARMLEGFVLQNVLLLKDIGIAQRKFQRLFVYLDTGFTLRALGLAGEAHATSTQETLDLLKATGAEFGIFEKTIEEMERILQVYERHLRTHAGILSLRPTDVTRHLIANHYAPSDVAAAMALIRENLTQLGIKIRLYPTREAAFTANESALTASLRRPDEGELEPRVTHDVDAVAAILTIRHGEKYTSLDTARAVFATTSTSVVRTVREWYRSTGERGVPPVVHAWALANAAWLKKPSAATNKKLHELVAICSAALRPGKKTWKAFVGELKRLQADGKITSAEQVALVARELVTCRLAEAEGDGDVDTHTIQEVIEEARAEERERTRVAVAEANAVGAETLAAAEAALAEAHAEARTAAEGKRQLELGIRGRARFLARATCWVLVSTLLLVVVPGTLLTLPGVWPAAPPGLRWLCWSLAAAVAILRTIALLTGHNVKSLRIQLEGRIEQSLLRWLTAARSQASE